MDIYWIAPPTLSPGDYTLSVTLEDPHNAAVRGTHNIAIPVQAGPSLPHERLVLENRFNPPPALPFADPTLRLIGYGFLERELWVERAAPLTLYWQVARDHIAPQMMSLALETSTTHHSLQPDCAIPPAADGALVESFCAIHVPKGIPAGRYRLTVTVGETTIILQTVNVRTRQHLYRVPAMQHKTMARLSDGMTLLGYDLDPAVAQPGADLVVTLYWRADLPPHAWLKVFTHLVGPDGALISQHDGPPAEGWAPTSEWVAREIVVDRHVIEVPADTPTGDGTIFVGMYSPDTGERLPAYDAKGNNYVNAAIPLCNISIRRSATP